MCLRVFGFVALAAVQADAKWTLGASTDNCATTIAQLNTDGACSASPSPVPGSYKTLPKYNDVAACAAASDAPIKSEYYAAAADCTGAMTEVVYPSSNCATMTSVISIKYTPDATASRLDLCTKIHADLDTSDATWKVQAYDATGCTTKSVRFSPPRDSGCKLGGNPGRDSYMIVRLHDSAACNAASGNAALVAMLYYSSSTDCTGTPNVIEIPTGTGCISVGPASLRLETEAQLTRSALCTSLVTRLDLITKYVQNPIAVSWGVYSYSSRLCDKPAGYVLPRDSSCQKGFGSDSYRLAKVHTTAAKCAATTSGARIAILHYTESETCAGKVVGWLFPKSQCIPSEYSLQFEHSLTDTQLCSQLQVLDDYSAHSTDVLPVEWVVNLYNSPDCSGPKSDAVTGGTKCQTTANQAGSYKVVRRWETEEQCRNNSLPLLSMQRFTSTDCSGEASVEAKVLHSGCAQGDLSISLVSDGVAIETLCRELGILDIATDPSLASSHSASLVLVLLSAVLIALQ